MLEASPIITSASDANRDPRFQELKAELHEQLISDMDFSVLRSVDPHILRDELRRGAEQLCGLHSDLISQADRNRLIDELLDDMMGLGPLEPLMHDPTVSDILINGPHCVFVERRGNLEETSVEFRDLDHLVEIVQRIAGRVGRRIDEASPMVDARLPDGSRLNAVIKPLALDGALVSIRRFSARPISMSDLVARQSASPQMLDFLTACVKARMSILVSGGTGSGKTTLLNALSGFIPAHERVVTIEDAAELQLQQPHVARMETRQSNLEGKGEVNSRELLRNALRMRPDRIIVGECRGAEAFDMLQAMNTGHEGGMSTIHANEARDALSRLEMLVGMAAPELPMWFIHRQIASAIQIVVQVARLPGGQRKIIQVSEVTGLQGESVSMHDIFTFRQTGVDDQNHVVGQFETTGIIPECLERFRAAGMDLPRSIFERGDYEFDRVDHLRGF
ncbi:CpaF family protein [Symmachiella dynata]|uniref:Conjugal transfer protein n=1 Tax=Symmachiella dynata TaxID=2527995 RepID=A0A517ZUQ0_9PLAN|nr:CpaF family protein [Symmachiella dynata]QDT50556.1 Putative conjugal transfer protein [Symmachiella dynata]QDU46214.1 Putative conjugal transfer protein [Symmachiella dynata]